MKPTLLLVDDVVEARNQLQQALAGGFDVVGLASSGLEAVELCERLKPGLVLMDLVMPQMSGLDAIRLIQARVRPSPRIVVLSGLSHEEVALAALEAGAYEYLIKPVSLTKIREALLGAFRQAA